MISRFTTILSIVFVYLLITTGTFVCIVHCSADYFLDKTKLTHQHNKNPSKSEGKKSHEHQKDGCNGDKDCPCCNQHDTYLVKENIKASFDFKIPPVPELFSHFSYQFGIYGKLVLLDSSWPVIHGPPVISGKDISIKFCSLLV